MLVVYPDIVFIENVVIDYFILLVAGKLSKSKTSNLRLLLGSALGAAYAVVMLLLPDMKIYTTFLAKIGLSLVMVAIAFTPDKISSFLKALAMFYLSTFIFGGAGFAFLYFNKSGGFIRNGEFITTFNTTWVQIFFAIAVAGIMIRVLLEVIQLRLMKEKLLVQLKIEFDHKAIGLHALVDTGNSLHDPLTNMPVVVVEYNAIKEILPEEIRRVFAESKTEDLSGITLAISGSSWFSRFRLIPFTSLGKENGMLIGFKPDYIEVEKEDGKKGTKDVIVGIYEKALSKNEKYRALLSPELI